MRNHYQTAKDDLKEAQMIDAHKAGREYARELDASLRAANSKARNLYITNDEQMSFVAGYLGELRRMTERN